MAAKVCDSARLVAIAPSGPTLPGMRELLAAAGERGPDLTVISDAPIEGRIPLEPVPEWLSPLVAVVPGQLAALRLAQLRGVDLDNPLGLSKITLTR